MAESAPQIQYRAEFIAAFEQRQSQLRSMATTDGQVNGSSYVFEIAGSGSDQAVTRGLNGLIPARADTLSQVTATLEEWHDLRRKTRFNIFTSQGDQRRIMQQNSLAVVNRKIDQSIITVLATGSQTTGAAATMSLTLATKALTKLGNNAVDIDGNVFGLLTPAAYAYLLALPSFASVDYVQRKPFESRQVEFDWAGVHWLVHPNLPGKGTNNETCFLWHRSAIGHACDMERLTSTIGYDEEQDYSYARTTTFMGSALLQNAGVVKIPHDGSAMA